MRATFCLLIVILFSVVVVAVEGCNDLNYRRYIFQGTYRLTQGHFDAAIRDYTKAIELDPKLAFAYLNRGHACKAKGDYDGALRDYKTVCKLGHNEACAKLEEHKGNGS